MIGVGQLLPAAAQGIYTCTDGKGFEGAPPFEYRIDDPNIQTYDTDLLGHVWVAALHSARERVAITTPYFIPDSSLTVALRLAAMAGTRKS